MDDCKGIFGKIFGHSFGPVFDADHTFNGDPAEIEKMSHQVIGPWLNEALDKMRNHKYVYVHHVCKRCGAVVHKSEDSKCPT